MLVQDDVFHTMKIVGVLGEHHAKRETILDLTKTDSLLPLQSSSLPPPPPPPPPPFLKPKQIFVKNVHNDYSTY